MKKRGKDGMLQFMKEPGPFPALFRHRAGCRSFGKLLCAMATVLVLASLTSTAAAGSGKMSRIGSFAGDTGAKVVVPYRLAVEALAFGVRNGIGDHFPDPASAFMGQRQQHPHLARGMTGGIKGYGLASSPVPGPSLQLARAYEKGSFSCKDFEFEKAKRRYREGARDHDQVAVLPRCLHAMDDNGPHLVNMEDIGRLTLASAQNKPVEQKISIKPRYSRRLCKFYAQGDFDKLQDYIQFKWKGLYTLENIYLSLRCAQYENRDLIRVMESFKATIDMVISSIELEEYFRKIAKGREGESLLTKVLYCKIDYLMVGRYNFFDYLEYHIARSQDKGISPFYINHVVQLRKAMSAHVRDFPFPDPRLELGPGEAREYRRKWCREHFAP